MPRIYAALSLWQGDQEAHVGFGAGTFTRPSKSEGIRHEDSGIVMTPSTETSAEAPSALCLRPR